MAELFYSRLKKKKDQHNCCVPLCKITKTDDIHLHLVPRDPLLRIQWAHVINTGKKLTDSMKICSKHFKSDDYINTCKNSF